MLTRRHLLVTSAAGVAASSIGRQAEAATPRNMLVIAKAIDGIVGAFDPAESYEDPNNEVCGNLYQKLIVPDPADANKLVGELAERWEVSKDGLVFTFHIRPGMKFDSGNALTAEDVAFSLQRVVKLNKTPGFILTQFGWNADNVDKLIRATGDRTLELTLPALQATTFVLYCLSATVGCVVEKSRVLANQVNNDLGNAWLKTHSAGSGFYRLVEWQASTHIILDQNTHAAVKPHIPRGGDPPCAGTGRAASAAAEIRCRHRAKPQPPTQLKGVVKNPDYTVARIDQLTSLYIGLNASLPQFQKVEVRQAIKWAIDYDRSPTTSRRTCGMSGRPSCRRARPARSRSVPSGRTWRRPRRCSPPAAIRTGSRLVMDYFARSPYAEIALAIQADLAQIGVKVQLLAGETKQVTTKMRAAAVPDDADELVPRLPRSQLQHAGVQRQPR
ncbi:MAG: ABC transporter substrate-binding protein [Acetobacteraceae bacterium]